MNRIKSVRNTYSDNSCNQSKPEGRSASSCSRNASWSKPKSEALINVLFIHVEQTILILCSFSLKLEAASYPLCRQHCKGGHPAVQTSQTHLQVSRLRLYSPLNFFFGFNKVTAVDWKYSGFQLSTKTTEIYENVDKYVLNPKCAGEKKASISYYFSEKITYMVSKRTPVDSLLVSGAANLTPNARKLQTNVTSSPLFSIDASRLK